MWESASKIPITEHGLEEWKLLEEEGQQVHPEEEKEEEAEGGASI